MWTVALELAAQRSSEVAATLVCPDWLETCVKGELDGLGLTRCLPTSPATRRRWSSSVRQLSARQFSRLCSSCLGLPSRTRSLLNAPSCASTLSMGPRRPELTFLQRSVTSDRRCCGEARHKAADEWEEEDQWSELPKPATRAAHVR